MREGNWWASVAGGALAFPVAVVPHELGHYGAYIAFGFPDPGSAVLLCRLVTGRGVYPTLPGGRHRGRSSDCRTVARGGRRGCRADRLLPDAHHLRACSPPIRPRTSLSRIRGRVGDPIPMDLGVSDPLPDAPRRTSLLGSGRTDRRGAHRNTPVLLHCTGPRLARAWILVPRESHPTRPEGADRRPHVGRVDPGWRPVGLVAGTPASFVKDRGERGACLDTQGWPRRSTVVVEANCGFWGGEGGVCRRGQAPGEGSAGMRGAFRRRGVASPLAPAGRSPGDSC